MELIASEPRMKGPGIVGLTVELVRVALKSREDFKLFARVLEYLASGQLAAEDLGFWLGARLTPLKPANKKDFRMIMAIELVRKLIERYYMRFAKVTQSLNETVFKSVQYAVSVPCGLDQVIHSCRAVNQNLAPGQTIVRLDCRKAFQNISRAAILRAVARWAPSLYKFVHTAFACEWHVGFHDLQFKVKGGVFQGAPLSTLLFALAFELFWTERVEPFLAAEGIELTFRKGYADDLHIALPASRARDLVRLINTEGLDYGIIINLEKSVAYTPVPDQLQDLREMGLMIVNNKKAQVLGIPIGDKLNTRKFMKTSIEKHRMVTELINVLASENARVAFELLRLCGGASLLVHCCRNIETSLVADFLQKADNNILRTFRTILGVPVDFKFEQHELIQITSSIGRGGCGLRSSRAHADLAFYTSLLHSLRTLRATGALSEKLLEALDSQCGELRHAIQERLKLTTVDWDKNTVHLQKQLSAQFEILERERFKSLTEKLSEKERLQVLFLTPAASPEANLWLTAKRSRACHRSYWDNLWDSLYFGMGIRYYLGMNMFKFMDRCLDCKGAVPLKQGLHLLTHKHGGHVHERTRQVTHYLGFLIKRFFGVPVRFETGADPASQKRPGDLCFRIPTDFGALGYLLMDHTCTSILSHPERALRYAEASLAKPKRVGPLSVSDHAERKKWTHNGISWQTNDFAPLNDRVVASRLLNLSSPIGKQGGANCYFWPLGSSFFGEIGPHMKALLSMLAENAVSKDVFPSYAAAMRSMMAEVTRLQVQDCMIAFSDYQSRHRTHIPDLVQRNNSQTDSFAL